MAKELLTTPKGEASYPWLNKADEKYNPVRYKTNLIVDANDASELVAKLEDILEEHYQTISEKEADSNYDEIRKADLPFYEEDGKIIFTTHVNKFGKNAKTGDEWENKVAFYDAGGKFMPEKKRPLVGGGSIIRVSFEPNLWAMPDSEGKGKSKKLFLDVGLSMRLKGIQVISVSQGGGERSAESMGFGVEEGGYEYNPDEFDNDSMEADEGTEAGDF